METRYLRKRGNVWWADFVFTKKVDGELRGKRCRFSLETSEFKAAADFRDRYILPLVRESRDLDILCNLAGMIIRVADRTTQAAIDLAAAADVTITEATDDSPASSKLTLRFLADKYITHLQNNNEYIESTIQKYRGTMRTLCAILGDGADPENISDADVRDYRDRMCKLPVGCFRGRGDDVMTPAGEGEKTISASAVRMHLQIIQTFFNWAIAESHLKRKNTPGKGIKIKKVKDNHKLVPTPEIADKLLTMPCPKNQDPLSWELMPVVARYTGCRSSEVAMLRAERIVVEQGIRCINIMPTDDNPLKTKSSKRKVPIAHKLAPVIDRLLELHPSGRLFPKCENWTSKTGMVKPAHGFLKRWNRAAKLIGDYSFHCLRVYANNQMTSAGVDIIDRERLLGHESNRTQEAYTGKDFKRYQRAVDEIS